MELQTAVTIALAIAALIVSILAIVLGILFYRFQTQQGNRIIKDNTDFAKEMHGLLGEIRGVTTYTQEQMQKQFNTMLEATVNKETTDIKAAVESATDKAVRELHTRMESLEQLIGEGPGETDAQKELEALKQMVNSLTGTVDEALIKATDAIQRERELELRLDSADVQPVIKFATLPKKHPKYENFTPRARKVISLSQEEAQRFNHNYVGTEHILLGLVREGEGVGAKVLASLGVELDKVRSAVEYIIGRGERKVGEELGLTPRAKHVIEFAVYEARHLNHNYIGTQHLLLGLLREEEGIAAGVLESLGINLEKARIETVNLSGGLITD